MSEKKYYWIKLKTDFFNQEAIDLLLSQPNGCQYVVLYQMLCLQTANTGGEMISRVGEMIIPYNVEKIARDTKYFDSDTVAVALELFKKLGLIYQEEDGILKIADSLRMVGSESANRDAIKKREYRLRQKIKDAEADKLGDKKEDKLVDKKGTKCPTEYRDKSIEYRVKSIDIDKDKEYRENIPIKTNKIPYNFSVTTNTLERKGASVFKKPKIEELEEFRNQNKLDTVDPATFYNYYESNGWKVGKQPMRSWQAAMRNWHSRNLKEKPNERLRFYQSPQSNPDDSPYEPEPTEDIRPWRDFFDDWERIIGMRPSQTVGNVKSAKLLKEEVDPEALQALLVALAMRGKTGYLTKEIKSISTPADLLRNKEKVWAFYQEHREQWQWQMSLRKSAGLD